MARRLLLCFDSAQKSYFKGETHVNTVILAARVIPPIDSKTSRLNRWETGCSGGRRGGWWKGRGLFKSHGLAG